MPRTLNTALPPQSKFSIGIALFGLLATFASSAHAQGVWDEPACGVEVTCGAEAACDCGAPACGCEVASTCEPACGCEPTCTCEPACGAEPACGCELECACEPARGFEPACGLEPACGCELSSGCNEDGERGLLSNGGRHKAGPIFHVLDTVACGLEKLATHRILAHHCTKQACHCGHCSSASHKTASSHRHDPTMSHQHTHCEPMPLSPPEQRVHMSQPTQTQPTPMGSALPPTPSLPEPIRDPGAPKTTIRRTDPLPIPTPSPQGDLNRRGRPGSLFDQMTNPFDDDSASRTARRPARIQRTTFADDGLAPNAQRRPGPALRKIATHDANERGSLPTSDAADYSDYFRQ